MATQILVFFQFRDPSITLRVSSSNSFDDFKEMLAKKGVPTEICSSPMVFSVETHPGSDMNNEDDWQNMMFLLDLSPRPVATITTLSYVQSRDCIHPAPPTNPTTEVAPSGNFTLTPINVTHPFINSSPVDVEPNEPHIDLPITSEKKTLLTKPWGNYIQGRGQVFQGGVAEFRVKLAKYHIEKGYKYRYVRNTDKQVIADCVKRESHGCEWYINATRIKYNKYFNIRILRNEHTCPMEVQSHKRLSAALKALLIVDKVKSNPDLKAPDVKLMFKEDYGLNISYKQAWRAIERARVYIFADQIDSYMELKWVLLNLKQVNPDSVIEFEAGLVKHSKTKVVKNRFQRAFVSFRASIDGFAHCRPMLSLDGTFLNGRYGGTLLAATAKDAQNGLFPVAFAIVSKEDKENWKWFLLKLLKLIPANRDVIYLSDRNVGLMSLFDNEFRHLTHFFCLHHLKMNLRDWYKGPSFKVEFKDTACSLLSECARAPTITIFEEKMAELKEFGGHIVIKFLKGLPLNRWAFAFAPCIRFGEMTSNVSESYNNWIKKARQLPISQCVDLIRADTMELFHDRRSNAASWKGLLCDDLNKKWNASLQESRGWTVRRCSEFVFEFVCQPTIVVNLETKKCDCYKWQFQGYPCSHAVAAIDLSKKDIKDFVEPYYFADTYRKIYEGLIIPVATMRKYTQSIDLGEKVFPPETTRPPGRPAKRRIPSRGEPPAKKRAYKCGRCGQYGHTAKTCKEPIADC